MDESYFDEWRKEYVKSFSFEGGVNFKLTIEESNKGPTYFKIEKITHSKHNSRYIESMTLTEEEARELYLILDSVFSYLDNKKLSRKWNE